MNRSKEYVPEFLLISAVLVISVLGFWDLYFAPDASPEPHHHFHAISAFAWLFLLLTQLSHVARGRFRSHRKMGLAVLLFGPLVVSSTAFLSVFSAQKGVASGQGDPLLVQNVMVTLELAALIVLAFVFRKNRAIHGSLLTSTSLLFGGIALFFALLSFVPMFRIEGPETFYRFGTAASTAQYTILGVGALLFMTKPKARWPYLLTSSAFLLNGAIGGVLAGMGLIDPLLGLVGSLNPAMALSVTFAVILGLIALSGLSVSRPTLAASQQ